MSTIENELADSETMTVGANTTFPMPPDFGNDTDAERTYRKAMLVDALHAIGKLGFAEGSAGHITVRDPEHLDSFWVNPFGTAFTRVEVDMLLRVNHDGEVLEGTLPLNNAAFAIHSAIHHMHPNVHAACHTHAIHAKTFSSLGVPLKMISQDHCMFYNDVAMHADSGGAIVTDVEAGMGLARSLEGNKAVIHQNHGIITTGETVDEAAWWFIALERACQAQLMAEAAGDPLIVPDEYAQLTYDQSGYPFAGWFQFQTVKQDLGLA